MSRIMCVSGLCERCIAPHGRSTCLSIDGGNIFCDREGDVGTNKHVKLLHSFFCHFHHQLISSLKGCFMKKNLMKFSLIFKQIVISKCIRNRDLIMCEIFHNHCV